MNGDDVMAIGRRVMMAMFLLVVGCGDDGIPSAPDAGCSPGDCPGDIPDRPLAETSSPSDSNETAFLLRDVRLEQSAGGAWREIGFDLDGRDTQSPDLHGDCSGEGSAEDGVNGIDNAFGASLWPALQGALPSFECEIHAAHSQGHGALVLQLSRWNGAADDAEVTVSILPSLDATSDALVAADCDDVVQNGDSTMNDEHEFHDLYDGAPGSLRPGPNLDGNDHVCLNPFGRVNGQPGNPPLIEDVRAYVAGGKVVLSFSPGSEIILFGGRSSFWLRLNEGRAVLPMAADFLAIEDALIGGRFPLNSLSQTGPNIGICDPTGVVALYETSVDILSDFDESADGSAACDALSVGLSLAGVRVHVAGDVPAAVDPFVACDGIGPLGSPFVSYPVQECCAALPVSEVLGCDAHHASPP